MYRDNFLKTDALIKNFSGAKLTAAETSRIASSRNAAAVAEDLAAANNPRTPTPNWLADSFDAIPAVEAPEIATSPAAPRNDNGENASPVAQTVGAEDVSAEQPRGLARTQKVTRAAQQAGKVATVADYAAAYGEHGSAMEQVYNMEGASQDAQQFASGYEVAYNWGYSGVRPEYLSRDDTRSYTGILTEAQRQRAYQNGLAAARADNKTPGSNRKKGVVKGDGVTIADLQKRFNDTQRKAYKYLSVVAEVTGIDIVLYQSKPNTQGKYTGAQGKYSRSEPGTIYIDLNAGLTDVRSADDLAKYAMLRTFAHEFTHFVENWNPIQYNEFRKVVFDTLAAKGENVDALIADKQARNPGMDSEQASREVVAEAMTDILPDTNFVQELAEKHKNIFQKLVDQLKKFAENLRNYFNSIGSNPSREANALKEQVGDTIKYLDNIVQLFDKAAVQAIENYQNAERTEIYTYGGVVNDTEQTATSYQPPHREWEESREGFLGRAGKALPEVTERGTLTFGYRRYSGQLSQNIQAAEEGLKKLDSLLNKGTKEKNVKLELQDFAGAVMTNAPIIKSVHLFCITLHLQGKG